MFVTFGRDSGDLYLEIVIIVSNGHTTVKKDAD